MCTPCRASLRDDAHAAVTRGATIPSVETLSSFSASSSCAWCAVLGAVGGAAEDACEDVFVFDDAFDDVFDDAFDDAFDDVFDDAFDDVFDDVSTMRVPSSR